MQQWFTIVSYGSDPAPERGPYPTVEAADEAVEDFQNRFGHLAGTFLAAGCVRLLGPFPEKDDACQADISDSHPVARLYS